MKTNRPSLDTSLDPETDVLNLAAREKTDADLSKKAMIKPIRSDFKA